MNQGISPRPLAWLKPGDPFPPITQAWEAHDPAPGLLAAGGCLDVPTLLAAYSHGIFPWFSDGEPPLWWSTDPRMVLSVDEFKLHRSLKRELRTLVTDGRLELRFDRDFGATIRACATAHRPGQNGTWIVEEMQQAYLGLHLQGHAHGIEAWVDGARCGGLYVVSMGRMVFGESMFSLSSNGSKLALCGLVAFCRHHGMPIIDCQQQTPHLASLGARPWERRVFAQRLTGLTSQSPVNWEFDPLYWKSLFTAPPTARDTPPRFAL
jgi:leucyl/phenylalanyl-tRNA---protein transferase